MFLSIPIHSYLLPYNWDERAQRINLRRITTLRLLPLPQRNQTQRRKLPRNATLHLLPLLPTLLLHLLLAGHHHLRLHLLPLPRQLRHCFRIEWIFKCFAEGSFRSGLKLPLLLSEENALLSFAYFNCSVQKSLSFYGLLRRHHHLWLVCLTVTYHLPRLVGFKRILLMSITTGVGGEIIRNIFYGQATIDSVTPICGMIGYMLGYYKAKSHTKWKYFVR